MLGLCLAKRRLLFLCMPTWVGWPGSGSLNEHSLLSPNTLGDKSEFYVFIFFFMNYYFFSLCGFKLLVDEKNSTGSERLT